ncbi:IS1182 family transposase [Kribbella sp. NPDC050820]|uniref:IS1182 family transposase n=1 Tax=Kribbella sp. NPDC050820 TaxID=3155408 RepID=UPI0033CB24BA
MQGRPLDERELLDAESVAGHLVEPGSVFRLLADQRRVLFPTGMFEDLFPSGKGRPSIPVDIVASVLVLQALHGLSDRDAVASVRTDLRWKVATGLPVGHAGFDPSTLTYWRRRLAASKSPHRIADAVLKVVAETGVLKGKNRRALDSTILDDAVATQDTVTQLIAIIRKVRREIPGAAAVVAAKCSAHDYDDPGKPRIAWDDSQARAVLVDGLVRDAVALLAEVTTLELTAEQTETVALLALIAGQDVEPADDSDGTDGRWQIARKVAKDRVISIVDPDARHAHKTVHRRQDGFKAHLAVEPETGIVTAAELTKASGTDAADGATGVRLLAADPTLTGEQPVDVLGDSAYGTGDALKAITDAGHTPMVKPWPTKPAVPGGFGIDDFTVDETTGTATCPNGVTRTITKTRNVVFGTACRDCPLRTQCTTAKHGRTLKLHEHHGLQREHRQRAKDPAWQADYRQHRPMVERSIAWLVTGRNRKLRYRGIAKNHAWLQTRTAALNLRRLLNLGLTRTDRTWAIA